LAATDADSKPVSTTESPADNAKWDDGLRREEDDKAL